jgi:hypothetical protein
MKIEASISLRRRDEVLNANWELTATLHLKRKTDDL